MPSRTRNHLEVPVRIELTFLSYKTKVISRYTMEPLDPPTGIEPIYHVYKTCASPAKLRRNKRRDGDSNPRTAFTASCVQNSVLVHPDSLLILFNTNTSNNYSINTKKAWLNLINQASMF